MKFQIDGSKMLLAAQGMTYDEIGRWVTLILLSAENDGVEHDIAERISDNNPVVMSRLRYGQNGRIVDDLTWKEVEKRKKNVTAWSENAAKGRRTGKSKTVGISKNEEAMARKIGRIVYNLYPGLLGPNNDWSITDLIMPKRARSLLDFVQKHGLTSLVNTLKIAFSSAYLSGVNGAISGVSIEFLLDNFLKIKSYESPSVFDYLRLDRRQVHPEHLYEAIRALMIGREHDLLESSSGELLDKVSALACFDFEYWPEFEKIEYAIDFVKSYIINEFPNNFYGLTK